MNRDQLFKVLQNTIKEFSIPNDTRLDNVEWKAENSQKSSLLFYSVKKEDNSFWERIKKYPFGILVINNGDVYKKIAGKENVILIDDKNWLEAQKKVLDVFCPMPEKLKFIGVTGTNGKTSTLHYMTQILTQLQKKNLLISTIGVFKNLEKVKDFNLTTPSFIDLRKSIHQFSSDGCVVLCEVSSHALDQDRYYGIDFDYAGWTNFTQDHLDYHQTMESYFLSKAKILPKTKGRVYTSETEDSFIQTLLKEQKVWGVDESKWSSLFKENTIFSINFNARNLALSLTLLSELGVSVDKKMISQLKEVPGRSNILNTHDKMIVVDFAHTPDALKNICQSLKNNYSNHSLVVLFGCGGDRDPSKRPLMAKAVEAYADRVYLTSDNPRFEDPKKIMNETFHGFLNTSKVICEVDRKKAIETAIGNLQDNEILLVAGKGHEPYLDVKGVKIPYNDSEYIKAVLENSMIEKKYFFEPTLVQDVLGNKDTLEEKLSVSTNTKILKKGEAFLAIKGEKHDGFKFVDQVVGKAPLIIFENSSQNLEKAKKIIQTHQDLVFIAVENSQKYTQTLAKIHCENWIKENNKKLIAISGSNGKTTTKEMLSFILNQLVPGKVISTFKNNNNHLGVPFTLFELDKKTIDLAVVEYGSNHPGEMKLLCNLSFPNMGVTTNIGETHMEFFKDTQAVFEEESEIYKRIEEVTQGKGFFLINNDDPYLKMLTPNQGSKTFGKNQDSDFVLSFDREKSLITINGKTSLQNSHILGEHNFINLAVAFLLADDVFPGRTGEIVKAASLFEPTSNRSQWREIGGCRIFLDAYNANPSSMRASIAEFITTAKQASSSDPRPLVILGDMMELGQNTLSYHEDLGRFAAGFPEVDFLYVGQWAENFMKGFKTENCQTFQNVQSAKTYVKEQITSRKSIFAKASRALQLESLFDIN